MGARGEPPHMTDERAKRFPLALADLVREPRKPANRAHDSRGKPAASVALKSASVQPVQAAKPGPSRAANATMKNPATTTASAKPATSVFPARSGAKPAASAAQTHHASHAPRTGALRAAARPVERSLNAAATATRKGAPNVALASTQTLTSERVRDAWSNVCGRTA
ncbi:Protein-L-isoaspartate O-methyltransferase [Candidatus Paraburkholderia kirkii]|nr:Protein-L-isoaspartate O-methyltransferase [Candidatus Paraburkholderia kirkii]